LIFRVINHYRAGHRLDTLLSAIA